MKPLDSDAFKNAVDAAAKVLKVPGAVVLLRSGFWPGDDAVVVVGTRKLGMMMAPDTGTHFRIASNTKTMTAALIVLLAQDGALKFTDPVSAYVTGVPNGENITIEELLKMRSGLYGYTDSPELAAALDANPGRVWTPKEVLAIAYKQPPNFAPGTSYEYSNTNYALLGMVAEKAGNHLLAQQFQDRLFGPRGLPHTSLPAADNNSLPDPYSWGYMYGDSSYALIDKDYPPEMKESILHGRIQPIDYTNQNPSYATAAGGAISTAHDLATWIKSLVSGKVFNAEYHQQWLDSPQPEDPKLPHGQEYGYGITYQSFGPDNSMYYHGGELPGFNSFIGHDLVHDVTLVIWTNLTLSPESKTTAQALLMTVLEQIYELWPQ
jgi:D-alanyl-D-alanine carboxypeptidase